MKRAYQGGRVQRDEAVPRDAPLVAIVKVGAVADHRDQGIREAPPQLHFFFFRQAVVPKKKVRNKNALLPTVGGLRVLLRQSSSSSTSSWSDCSYS